MHILYIFTYLYIFHTIHAGMGTDAPKRKERDSSDEAAETAGERDISGAQVIRGLLEGLEIVSLRVAREHHEKRPMS